MESTTMLMSGQVAYSHEHRMLRSPGCPSYNLTKKSLIIWCLYLTFLTESLCSKCWSIRIKHWLCNISISKHGSSSIGDTSGSILYPSSANSAVGIKPTVGLTSRAGVIPVSHRQDTIGPICRTVSDAFEVLDAIVGFDRDDFTATKKASTYIPHGEYRQFLKADGLKDKRLGISKDLFGFNDIKTYQQHFNTLRQKGAVLVDNLVIPYTDLVNNAVGDAQSIALSAEFKMDLNAYLKNLVHSQVRSLADIIAFNKISAPEKLKEYGQDILLESEKTNGIGKLERGALRNITKACKYGFEKMMKENKLDALMSPGADIAGLLAIGGYPGINVPAGYDENWRTKGF